jgi:hypothetical protein
LVGSLKEKFQINLSRGRERESSSVDAMGKDGDP